MITIERVANGFIFTDTEKDKFGEVMHTERQVFADDDACDKPEAEAAYNLLWTLIETLGVGGNRYDPKRLKIVWEAGDKYEDQ